MARTSKARPYAGGRLTEAGFFGFIRSALRSKSRRWWPIHDCLRAARRPSQSDNKRLKWEFQCAHCSGFFAEKDVNVDHKIPAGSLNSFEDLPGFVKRLFCEGDGLQILCDPCHHTKTQQEKQ